MKIKKVLVSVVVSALVIAGVGTSVSYAKWGNFFRLRIQWDQLIPEVPKAGPVVPVKKFKKWWKVFAPGKVEVIPPVVEEPVGSNYKWHNDITATMFWLGEEASDDNGWISNVSTAYESPIADSVNPFYVAVPYEDMEYVNGQTRNKESAKLIPWYAESQAEAAEYEFYSYVKNRWVLVRNGDKVGYGQVQDSGPYYSNDFGYVFGDAEKPMNDIGNRSGIDLSIALDEYVDTHGLGQVDWKFVDEDEVPDGPWKENIERQQCVWGKYGDVK